MIMDEETITIPLREWEKLQEELRMLRKEVSFLKKDNLAMSFSPKTMLQNSQEILPIPPMIKKNSNPESKIELKKSMAEWSKKIQNAHYKCFQKGKKLSNPPKIEEDFEEDEDIAISIPSQENQQFAILEEQPQIEEDNSSLKLLQCVCLYGPNKYQLQQAKFNKRGVVRSQLHYISNPQQRQRYEGYGSYFYPEGEIKTKRIRQEEVMIQINRIIFKKNTKRDECQVYLFQKDQNNNLLKEHNEVLESVNPGKWLTAFCIQFHDYFTCQDDGDMIDKSNQSFGEQSQVSNQVSEGSSSPDTHNRSANLTKSIKMTIQKSICVVSKLTLCIFTYFPFVSLVEKILISIVDEIKGRRIAAYAQETQRIQDINYQFFVCELDEICQKLNYQINQIPPQIDASGTIVIGVEENPNVITIQLTKSNLMTYFYSGWAYQLMKQYDKDKVYQIFCNILLQETVILVCENLHVLTYMIFLFVLGLPRPIYYPHPCVSVIFNLELLDTPFIVTAGVNNSSKWLKENANTFNDKVVFIDLNKSEESSIFDKKKSYIKSEKLRKAFSIFYKKVETPLFKKKEKIIKSTSKEENLLFYKFVQDLNEYFKEEIFKHLPQKQMISCMHEFANQSNENNKISNLLKQISKFIKESRKQKDTGKEKDMFLNEMEEKDSILNIMNKDSQIHTSFLSTQIFSVYLSDYYGFY